MAKNNNAAPKTEKRILSEEDLAANPELEEAGLKVGDEIEVPAVPSKDNGENKKDNKNKKTIVEFTKHYMPYAKGDVAGVDKKEAEKMVGLGVAKVIK